MSKRTQFLVILLVVIGAALVAGIPQPRKVSAKARGDATFTPEPSLTPTLTMPSESPVITVDNAAQITELAELYTKEPWIMHVAFSPDSSILATLDAGGIITLWRAKTASKFAELNPNSDLPDSNGDVQFSPDGSLLASSNGSDIFLWAVRDALTQVQPTSKFRLQGHRLMVSSVAFSPDGTLLASSDGDFSTSQETTSGSIRLWETSSGTQIQVIRTYTVGACCLKFSSDGTKLVFTVLEGTIYGWSSTIRVWSISEHRQISSSTEKGFYSPDGKLFFVSVDKGYQVFDSASRTALYTLQPEIQSVWVPAFSPDGTMLALADGTEGGYGIDMWNLKTGQKIANLDNAGAVTSIVFSPDGKLIAVGEDGAGLGIAYAHIWGIRQ